MSLAAEITLPRRRRGRQSTASQAQYDANVAAFCEAILQIRSTLDFDVSSRGWAYIFENRGVITKDELDACQDLINECRKNGMLPLDICAADETRTFENIEQVDETTPAEEARYILADARRAHLRYRPRSFWEFQDCYVQMVVEKIDLKSLFGPVCAQFHVPIANAKGWSDLNLRADMMRRFGEWQDRGKQPVLLYCGDFDPAGINISRCMADNLADLAGAVGWHPEHLIINRFGLNRDFIDEHGLTWIDNLITGSGVCLSRSTHPDHGRPYVQNYIRQHGVRKVEANALVVRPEAGRALCRDAVLQYVDLDGAAEFHRVTQERRELVAAEVARLMREHE
jgi:hypothetical protein